MNKLILKRFCGEEIYPVKNATWRILDGDGTWDDPYSLWLEITCGPGKNLSEDTKSLDAEPNLDISFYAVTLREEGIKAGFIMENQNEEDESDALMYYCAHQPMRKNQMEVLEREGDVLVIRLTGETTDVNYYDGSKPDNTIEITARFLLKK